MRTVTYVCLLMSMACAHARRRCDFDGGAVTAATQRYLSDLDINTDGQINEDDVANFEAIAGAARQRATQEHAPILTGLYRGPKPGAKSIFSFVGRTTAGVEGVPSHRLLELDVEARWAARQAKLAHVTGLQPSRTLFTGALRHLLPNYNADSMAPKTVCDALRRFDVTALRTGGDEVLTAVFDLDGTVWRGNVLEAFLGALAEYKIPKAAANEPLVAFLKGIDGIDIAQVHVNDVSQNARLLLKHMRDPHLPKTQRVGQKDGFYQTVALLAGVAIEEVQKALHGTFEVGTQGYRPWQQNLFATANGCGMREIIAILAQRGITVYLLSATLDILAKVGGRMLGIADEQIQGSILEVAEGRFTGRVLASTYDTKGSIVRQWLPTPPLFAFGDSPISDFSMLQEAAVTGFMINPRYQLQARDDAEADARMVALWFPEIQGEMQR